MAVTPLLKAQADWIATFLKLAESGGLTNPDDIEQVEKARRKKSFRLGILLEDNVIVTLELGWDKIREVSHDGLVEYILMLVTDDKPKKLN